ncbi:MAG TPA: OB-fold domain-containing protein [Acidimicrobiales bacterium]|nr:OB-fold domain-containing protein [Acidimicrobiales bacterium]
MTMLRPQPPGTPLPVPSPFSAPYWEGCSREELRYLRCANCHLAIADAPRICWRCHSRDLRWEKSGGRGRLYSWTIVWRPQTPVFEVPYSVAIVQLDEGIFVVSSIIGCQPEDLVDGMEVAFEFHPVNDELKLPYFRPVFPGGSPPPD